MGGGLEGQHCSAKCASPFLFVHYEKNPVNTSAHSTAHSLEAHVTQGPVNFVLVLVSLTQSVFQVLLLLSCALKASEIFGEATLTCLLGLTVPSMLLWLTPANTFFPFQGSLLRTINCLMVTGSVRCFQSHEFENCSFLSLRTLPAAKICRFPISIRNRNSSSHSL